MAKLIVLALAFTALVAFATAHTTIFTTTTIENPVSKQQCRRQLQREQFNQCQMYLQQDQSPYENPRQQQEQGIQQCCQELQRIDNECVCEAVTQMFGEAAQQIQQRQQGQQSGRSGSQQIQQLKQKAQNIPDRCNIQTEKCQIRTTVSTTTIDEENPSHVISWGCRQIVQRQPFNQCQRFIGQQIRSPILMAINKQVQQTQGIQQCCNEIQYLTKECQCEAMKEVYNKVIRQQQQQQGSQYGGKQQQTEQVREQVRQIIQNLPNQCDLDVEQCRIPSEMF